MIDIESAIFSPIYTALKDQYDGIYVTSEPAPIPSKPLAVSIVQMDNYSSIGKQDNTLIEKYVTIMFQVDVYCNYKTGKKSKCKEVLAMVDDMMFKKNFMRISLTPIPMEDNGYYRLTARYRAETDGQTMYRI